MTVQFLEGFDKYNGLVLADGGLPCGWSYTPYSFSAGSSDTGNIYTVTTEFIAGRFGGQAIRFRNLNGTTSTISFSTVVMPAMSRSAATASASFAFGLAIRCNIPWREQGAGGVVCPGYDFILLDSSGNPHLGFKISLAGALQIYRMNGVAVPQTHTSGTLLGSFPGLVFGQWHYMEFAGTIADSGAILNAWLDNVQVLTLTGLDTRNAGQLNVQTLQIMALVNPGGASPPNRYGDVAYDDVYFRTTSTTRLGEGRVATLSPTSDTATIQFTPSSGINNYLMVDETPYSTVDFISGSAVNNTDLYEFEDLVGTPGNIFAVAVTFLAQKTDGAARSIAGRVDSGGSLSNGSDLSLTASPKIHQRIMETNPNGSVAWTAAAVNALKAGPRVTV